MTKVHAVITTSVDGYITGPDDGPGRGLGVNGERLHAWVFGGRWSYGDDLRAVVAGRWTYEAAEHWGDSNPFGVPFFIVTHRPQDEPGGQGFTFVFGVEAAVERAREAAGARDVHVMGGADIIRQVLDNGLADELTIIIAPVIMGGGKRLFDGFTRSLDLEHVGVRQSEFATFIDYRINRSRASS
jgi:dihydrofolate reductase